MKRIAIIAFVIAGCTCCTPPLRDLQNELRAIRAEYVDASDDEIMICATRSNCDAVRTAHYNAAAALMVAESDPTESKVASARSSVAAFIAEEQK